MVRQSGRSSLQLPQSSDRWLLATAQLRLWVSPLQSAPYRPYIVFVVSGETGGIRSHTMTHSEPTIADVRRTLLAAMQKPAPGSGKPSRPEGLIVTSEAIGKGIADSFKSEPLGVRIYLSEMPAEAVQIVRELEDNLRGRPEPPGLLAGKGVTPELLAGVFAAAADFFRAEPWVRLANMHVLALRHPGERAFRYAIVMGNGGMEYGLSVYRRLADIERILAGDAPPLELMPAGGAHSLSFETIGNVPFDDLEALQQHGWQIAADDAYSVFLIINRKGEVSRPSRADLCWYEAALRAIPLLRERLQPDGHGDFLPLETTVSVPTHAGEVQLAAKYPAGPLRLTAQPARRLDWSADAADAEALPFDMRAMEGTLSQPARDMGAPTVERNRKLERAQQLMYRAWEEANPAKRLALAHDALAVSPDCADAYVLLAEDEAPTVEKAIEYCRQGVEAGERALGRDYFAANEGYFWSLMETRPYMRARLGLARVLWQVQQTDDAIAHFREMLRLNPGDNQGIRYLLLDLLMHLECDADAGALLEQYADDAMALWLYSRALHAFRTAGAGEKRIPPRPPQTMGFGDKDEAIAYAAGHLNHWRRTVGALEWLKTQKARKPAGKRKRTVWKSARKQ